MSNTFESIFESIANGDLAALTTDSPMTEAKASKIGRRVAPFTLNSINTYGFQTLSTNPSIQAAYIQSAKVALGYKAEQLVNKAKAALERLQLLQQTTLNDDPLITELSNAINAFIGTDDSKEVNTL